MKQTARIFLFAIFLAFAVSCGSDRKGASADVSIDTFATKSNVSFFKDVFTDIRAIPLDLDGHVLGAHHGLRLRISDGRYVLTDMQSKSVYAFGRDGGLLTYISKEGRGPGEYTSLLTCEYVDHKYVVLAESGHIIEYDGQGSMVREFFLEQELMDMLFVDAGTPVLVVSRIEGDEAAEQDRILVCDADYKPQHSFCPLGFQLFNYDNHLSAVAGCDGEFLYVEPTATRFLRCNKEGVLHSCDVDLQGKGFPKSFLESVDWEKILEVLMKTPDLYCYNSVFENDRYYLLSLEHIVSGNETERGQWLVRKEDGSSRVEYIDEDGTLFAFLGLPLLLTEQDEIVYVLDMDMYGAVADDIPELAAVLDGLDVPEGGAVLLVCKIA
ncbi:MAG: 6-bladed beta-propeller [Bacteroidales bacterium]|nr:6-bladed beta-propeller [Bacteroidales bacterium]